MRFALLTKYSVRFVDLRETKCYLIDDSNGNKYKKFSDKHYPDMVASNKRSVGFGTYTGDDVYVADSATVNNRIKEIRQMNFISSVKKKLEESVKGFEYDDWVFINNTFKLGVSEVGK